MIVETEEAKKEGLIDKEIKDFIFLKIFINLNKSRKKGTLVVKTPAFTKKVFFDKGEPIFALSTEEDNRLGEVLVKAGKITLEQCKRSLELHKKTGESLTGYF